MSFEKEKSEVLGKRDKSRKGAYDEQILGLIDNINSFRQFFTTSSCSGRITILATRERRKKHDVSWHFVSHTEVREKDVLKAVMRLPEDLLWLRMESFIIHVRAESLKDASVLLVIGKQSGFKHSGIISLGRKIIVEIFGTERLDVPISLGGRLIVDESYMKYLIVLANEKLLENHKKIKKMESLLEDYRKHPERDSYQCDDDCRKHNDEPY